MLNSSREENKGREEGQDLLEPTLDLILKIGNLSAILKMGGKKPKNENKKNTKKPSQVIVLMSLKWKPLLFEN